MQIQQKQNKTKQNTIFQVTYISMHKLLISELHCIRIMLQPTVEYSILLETLLWGTTPTTQNLHVLCSSSKLSTVLAEKIMHLIINCPENYQEIALKI